MRVLSLISLLALGGFASAAPTSVDANAVASSAASSPAAKLVAREDKTQEVPKEAGHKDSGHKNNYVSSSCLAFDVSFASSDLLPLEQGLLRHEPQ